MAMKKKKKVRSKEMKKIGIPKKIEMGRILFVMYLRQILTIPTFELP